MPAHSPGDLPLTDLSDILRYVRVTGVRRGRFVEFQFSLGDPDLTVDLVLPYPAFREFCTENRAVTLPSDPRVQQMLDALGDPSEPVRSGPSPS